MINQKLIDSGLFAARMVDVEGPLVALYNRCLTELGFTPTNLKSFRIDGYGWSPEIAQEQSNNAYLSHGDANPFAIILSPKQAGLPVFYPYHNFDRKMMGFVYEDFKDQIEEVTKTTAIIVDIDRYVQFLEMPLDLLSYNKITVKCKILGNLLDGKIEQDYLIEELREGENFLVERMQQKLVANLKQYGDLRGKNILMEPQSYDISSFYTRMFGGVFLFKETYNQEPLMICVDKSWIKTCISDHCTVTHIGAKKAISALEEKDYIQELNDEIVFERIKDWAFVSAISSKPRDHSMTEIMNNKGLFMKYLQQYKADMGIYKSIETKDFDSSYIGQYAPNASLPTTQYRLMWKLLTTMEYCDIFLLYKWNKEKFYKEFNLFPADVQDWVVEYVVHWNKKYYEENPD